MFAKTINTPASPELVIHALEPFSTNLFPSLLAEALRAKASEPLPHSLRPKTTQR